jgi:hypothetical protein
MHPHLIVQEPAGWLKSKSCGSRPLFDESKLVGARLLDRIANPSLDVLPLAVVSVLVRAFWLSYRSPCEFDLSRLASKALRQRRVEATAPLTYAPRLRRAAVFDPPVHEHRGYSAPAPTADVSLADETSCSPTHSAPKAGADGQRARTTGQTRPRSTPKVPTPEPAGPSSSWPPSLPPSNLRNHDADFVHGSADDWLSQSRSRAAGCPRQGGRMARTSWRRCERL